MTNDLTSLMEGKDLTEAMVSVSVSGRDKIEIWKEQRGKGGRADEREARGDDEESNRGRESACGREAE